MAGDFCEALGIFWSYLRAEYVRMCVTWNVYYLAVVVTVVAGARQCEIQARVTFVEATI